MVILLKGATLFFYEAPFCCRTLSSKFSLATLLLLFYCNAKSIKNILPLFDPYRSRNGCKNSLLQSKRPYMVQGPR